MSVKAKAEGTGASARNGQDKPSCGKFVALCSYLGILCLVPLVLNRKEEFVRFHAKQGLVIWMWEVVAIFTLFIPVLGHLFFTVSFIICALLSLVGILQVLANKSWKFPVIGNLAENL